MEITKDIHYIGVNDRDIDLFEGQFIVENGMAYNSYVIMDDKIAVMDTVESDFGGEWLQNLQNILGTRTPDYLVVQHMEPDHSSNIDIFAKTYPEAVILASAPAFTMMRQFFGTDYADRQQIIKEGDTLSLGTHTLQFIAAPMVHWPEVMVTYDSHDKVPVLKENLEYYVNLYQTWSSYGVESEGVMIAYTSVYGNTKAAAGLLAEKLTEKGCPKVVVADLAREDMAECVEDAFRYGKLVLATTTYNAGIFPYMREFIDELVERNYQNRMIALMENGSWAPMAAKTMRAKLENCKDITFAETAVQIRSAMSDENKAQIEALAAELCGS